MGKGDWLGTLTLVLIPGLGAAPSQAEVEWLEVCRSRGSG